METKINATTHCSFKLTKFYNELIKDKQRNSKFNDYIDEQNSLYSDQKANSS